MSLNSLPASGFCWFPSILPVAARVFYSGSDLPKSRSPVVLLESRCFIIGFYPSSQQAVPPLSCRARLSHSKDCGHSLQMEGWPLLPRHWLVWTASLHHMSVESQPPSGALPFNPFFYSVHSRVSIQCALWPIAFTLALRRLPQSTALAYFQSYCWTILLIHINEVINIIYN